MALPKLGYQPLSLKSSLTETASAEQILVSLLNEKKCELTFQPPSQRVSLNRSNTVAASSILLAVKSSLSDAVPFLGFPDFVAPHAFCQLHLKKWKTKRANDM